MPNWRRPLLRMGLRSAAPRPLASWHCFGAIQFDRAAIQRLHEQRLTALLGHAWSTTEYYRQVLTEVGAVRNGVVDLARFEDIPFLTRDILRDQFDRLTSRSLPEGRRAYRNATGGSTGQPAQFLQDNVYWDVNVATKLFHFEWFGKQPGDRELKIWGAEHDLLKGREGPGLQAQELALQPPLRAVLLPAGGAGPGDHRPHQPLPPRPDLGLSRRHRRHRPGDQPPGAQGAPAQGRLPGRRHHLPAHRGGGGEGLRRPGDQHLWRPRDRRRRLPVPRAWRPARLPELA